MSQRCIENYLTALKEYEEYLNLDVPWDDEGRALTLRVKNIWVRLSFEDAVVASVREKQLNLIHRVPPYCPDFKNR